MSLEPNSIRAEMHERWCHTRPRLTIEQERDQRVEILRHLRPQLVTATTEKMAATVAFDSDEHSAIDRLERATAEVERLQAAIARLEVLVG